MNSEHKREFFCAKRKRKLKFEFTIMFSSTALAANWVKVGNGNFYVDTDSIKRGVKSRVYELNENKGYSARCKNSFEDHNGKLLEFVGLWWFFKEDGKKKYAALNDLERYENGKKVPVSNKSLIDVWTAEGSWEELWDFVAEHAK